MRNNVLCFALSGLMATSAPALHAAWEPTPTTNKAGVAYLSGGVGEEERDRMKPLAGDFNLRLVFTGPQGEYLAGVPLLIRDSGGRQVLAAVSDGPLVFARLPAGTYKVIASIEGDALVRTVSLQSNNPRILIIRLDETATAGRNASGS